MSTGSKYDSLLPEMVELRESGMFLKDIGERLGIRHQVVQRLLQKAGVSVVIPVGTPSLPDFGEINPSWLSEFRGFFFGEGCIYFRANLLKNRSGNQNSRKKLTPVIEISLRIDDADIISDLCDKFGGQLSIKSAHGATNRAASWKLVGWARVYAVSILLLDCQLPSRKLHQIKCMIDACESRFQMSHDLTPDEYDTIYSYYLKLRDLKLLKS